MTNEEMQSTIQFLLDQQARYAARAEIDAERITRVEAAIEDIKGVAVLLTQVARNADERMDNFDAHLKAQRDEFNASLSAQRDEFNARMTALDERLNILINVVERHITHGNGHA